MANAITTTSGTAMEYGGSGAAVVDPNVTVTGDNFTGDIDVEIATGLVTADDVLSSTAQLPPSIVADAYSAGTGLLQFACVAATPAEITTALQGVAYENTAADSRTGSQRKVSYTLNGVSASRYVWIRDPFTQIETELWSILESHADLSGIIKPIKHTGEAGLDDDPLDTYQPGDLANVRLMPAGNTGQTNLKAHSAGGFVGQRWNLVVVTGDRATRRLHNPIKWGVIKAISSHIADNPQNWLGLGPITGGHGIVNGLSWQVLAEDDGDPANDRGAVGYVALMAIDVRFVLNDAQARV